MEQEINGDRIAHAVGLGVQGYRKLQLPGIGAQLVGGHFWVDFLHARQSELRKAVKSDCPPSTNEKSQKSHCFVGFLALFSVDGGGVEPPTHGFSVRCSTN
jgi:hypothetical protein